MAVTATMMNLSTIRRAGGFTLIEMSIVLVIIAMLMGGGIGMQQAADEQSKVKLTEERLKEVIRAIDEFVDFHGYLPCPSDPSLVFDNAGFGFGLDDVTTGTDPMDVATTANDCTTNNGLVAATAANTVRGGVPVYTLGIHPSYSMDGFGNRFVYVIDQDLAFRGDGLLPDAGTRGYTQGDNDGVSNNLDATGNIEISLSGGGILRSDVAVLVYSAGANGFGAWPARGGAQQADTAASTGEKENSDNDARFVEPFGAVDSDDQLLYLTKWQLDADRKF